MSSTGEQTAMIWMIGYERSWRRLEERRPNRQIELASSQNRLRLLVCTRQHDGQAFSRYELLALLKVLEVLADSSSDADETSGT